MVLHIDVKTLLCLLGKFIKELRFRNVVNLAAFLCVFIPSYATYKILDDPEKFSKLIKDNDNYEEHIIFIDNDGSGCITLKIKTGITDKYGTFISDKTLDKTTVFIGTLYDNVNSDKIKVLCDTLRNYNKKPNKKL